MTQSFCECRYGFIANLDIDTEPLRFLGGERFTLGAVWELIKWKGYRATLAWVDWEHSHMVQERGSQNGSQPSRCTFVLCIRHHQRPVCSRNKRSCHDITFTKHRTMLYMRTQCSIQDERSFVLCSGPRTPMLDAVLASQSTDPDQPLQFTEGWTKLDSQEIHYFNLQGPAWSALDYHLNPWGKLDDGLWEMAIDTCQGRVQATKLFLQTDSGAHESSPQMQVTKVAAFAIIPESHNTHLTVDGEEVACEPLLAEIHKGLLRVVCAPDMM